jgi:hypothetical protein
MRRSLIAVLALALVGVGAPTLVLAAPRARAPNARGPSGPRLTAEPFAVRPGDTLVLRGRGFPKRAEIALFVGPPGDSTRIGGAQTGTRGRFVASIRIRRPSDPDRYLLRACHDGCRVTAIARFRIVAP